MRQKRIQIFSLLLAILVSLFASHVSREFVAPIDHTLNDWRTRLSIRLNHWYLERNKLDPYERRFVIIDIDEKTFAEQGPWPWRREKVSELLRILTDEYQVSSAALDIVFPEARADDVQLAKQMRKPLVTGAVVYDLLKRELPAIDTGLPATMLATNKDNAPVFLGVPSKANHAVIMPQQIGHITPIFDSDGTIRHLPPVICHTKKPTECRPLLEIVAFASLLQNPRFELQKPSSILSAHWELLIKDEAGDTVSSIPLDSDGAIVVPYRHQFRDWVAVSATDVLMRRANADILRGSIVLLGSTALGMGDVVSTPVRSEAAGLEPHAEVLSALFEGNFVYQPRISEVLVFFILLALASFLRWAIRKIQSPLASAFVYPMWMALSWFGCASLLMYLYMAHEIMLPLVPFFLFPPMAVFFCILAEYYSTNKQKISIFNLLSTYLPKQVAHRLSDQGRGQQIAENSIDATRREMTVLFADIRGFTGLVEKCSPELVAALMHRVFTEMAVSVVNHGGTIDKFIGDAVMAFWNAPDDDPDHADHAFQAALEMVERIAGLGDFCRTLGVDPVTIGIGLESGTTLVGHFGSAHRRTYTALGETVVLASRIEGLSVQYDQDILIGPNCAIQLDQSKLLYLGRANVRGRQQTIDIFAPKLNKS